MKFAHIIDAIHNEPWLIKPSAHASICKVVEWRMGMTADEWQARKREGETISGDKVELDSMTIQRGIARIPFAGVLIKGAAAWEKGSGALAHGDVEADISEAVNDPNVRAIFFDVDSPGGTCAGSFELADLIAATAQVKPTMAWVEGCCASAAFLCMSGCGLIYGSRTSEIGAIECYMPWVDVSLAYKEKGYVVDIIKPDQSKHAAAGFRGTSLSEEQRAYLKEQTEDLLRMYVTHINEARPKVPESAMDGRTFIGQRGIEVGMFDSVTTKEQAIADLRQWAKVP